MLLWVLARVLYTLNIKLPKLPKINVEKESAPTPEKKSTKTPYVTRESQTTSDSDLLKKLAQATWKKQAAVWAWSKVEWPSNSGSLFKDGFSSLFKQKVQEKIEEKQQKPRPQIHFSWDKPTFPVSLLTSNLSEAQQVDEKAIVEKAQALQNKLSEFWIYISIEWFDIWPSVV